MNLSRDMLVSQKSAGFSLHTRILELARIARTLIWEITVWVRWFLLKILAILAMRVSDDQEYCDHLIIRIGNKLFRPPFQRKVFLNYDSFLEHNPADLTPYLNLLSPDRWITSRTILDLGSGLGSYSSLIKEIGADVIVAMEYQKSKAEFCSNRYGDTVLSVIGTAVSLPFKDKCFDTIFSKTVFEHLPDLDEPLKEMFRVLLDDGIIVLSFNYFHQRRGDHLFPYIHFPWPTWVVSEKSLCLYWSDMLAKDQEKGLMRFFPVGTKILHLEQGSEISLNKATFDDFEEKVHNYGFVIVRRISAEPFAGLFPFIMRIPRIKYFLGGSIYYVLAKR